MPSELIIGVTGGIAAYKTAALVSSLVQEGHGVTVVIKQHGGNTATGKDCLRIIEQVNDPGVKMTYDAGNVLDYNNDGNLDILLVSGSTIEKYRGSGGDPGEQDEHVVGSRERRQPTPARLPGSRELLDVERDRRLGIDGVQMQMMEAWGREHISPAFLKA